MTVRKKTKTATAKKIAGKIKSRKVSNAKKKTKTSKTSKTGRVIKPVNKQKSVNQSKTDKKIDAKRKAMAPGWRISKNGNRYYEDRANRSDKKGSRL